MTVHLANEFLYMMRRRWVADTIQRYCDFIPFPIELEGSGRINTMDAPWHVASWPDEATRAAAWDAFIQRHFREEPLEVIPIDIEEPIRARGALFISAGRIPDVNAAGMVDLYVRRMFVRGRDPELLPPWAKFVRGVIDTPDLIPTAARDNVHRRDANWVVLQRSLGDRIIDGLVRLATHQPDRFRSLSRVHGAHLASLAVENERFFAGTQDQLLFETNRGLLPLADCIAAVDPVIYYFPAEAGARQYYALANARGIVAVNARDVLEEDLLIRYSHSRDPGPRLVRLDMSRDMLLLRTTSLESVNRAQKLVQATGAALRRAGLTGLRVSVRRYEPTNRPAILLMSPDAAADLRLTQLADEIWMTDSLQQLTRDLVAEQSLHGLHLIINEDHALVQRLLHNEPASTNDDALRMLLLAACLHAREVLTHDVADRLLGPFVRVLTAATDATAAALTAEVPNRGEYAIAG